MIQPQVKREERFQILDKDRTRDVGLVGEQAHAEGGPAEGDGLADAVAECLFTEEDEDGRV